MNTILDNPKSLMNLSREELDEILLDSKYNRPMLRELVRRCLKEMKDARETIEYLRGELKTKEG